MNTLENIKNSKMYKELLETLSDEEKKILEASIENLVNNFEKGIINPLKNIK